MKKIDPKKLNKSALFMPLAIVALAELVIILALLVKLQVVNNERFAYAYGTDKSTAELLDSVTASLPKQVNILAKFTDKERHAMYYVQESLLYKFDLFTRETSQIEIKDRDGRWEIYTADLSPNDSAIVVNTLFSGDTSKGGLFRYNLYSSNLRKLAEGRITETDDGYEVENRGRRRIYDKRGELLPEPERRPAPVAAPADSMAEEQLPPPAEYEDVPPPPPAEPQGQPQLPPPAEPESAPEPAN